VTFTRTLHHDLLWAVLLILEKVLKLFFCKLDWVPAEISSLCARPDLVLEMELLAIRPQPVVNRLVGGGDGELGVVKETLLVRQDVG
jgi:hypothetical protein